MRFTVVASLAFVGAALAVPMQAEKRSLITDVGNVIADLETGLGVTEVTEKLDKLLGGGLTKVRPFQRSNRKDE